jgi:hypothetical protein
MNVDNLILLKLDKINLKSNTEKLRLLKYFESNKGCFDSRSDLKQILPTIKDKEKLLARSRVKSFEHNFLKDNFILQQKLEKTKNGYEIMEKRFLNDLNAEKNRFKNRLTKTTNNSKSIKNFSTNDYRARNMTVSTQTD